MSAQVERPYRILTDNLTIQDTIKTKTPLSGSFSYYQQYLRLLDRNADRLKSLFREQNRDYLKGLLEELDNNVEMAIQILKGDQQEAIVPEQQPHPLLDRPAQQLPHHTARQEQDIELLKQQKAKAEQDARGALREAKQLKSALIKVYNKFKRVQQANEKREEQLIQMKNELNLAKIMLSNRLSEEFADKTNIDNFDVC